MRFRLNADAMGETNGLANLITSCMASLGESGNAGRDLAAGNIASDEAARHRHTILQAFQDSRNVDWGQLYDNGVAILRGESKDLLALWAVLAPLPIVRATGLGGLAVSVELCRHFLQDYWESMYPRLPEGLNLRASVISQLTKRWTSCLQKTTATEADVESISRIADELEQFEAILKERFPPDRVPQLGEFRQLIRSMKDHFTPKEKESPVQPDSNADSSSTTTLSGAGPATGARRFDVLEQAYSSARQLIRSKPSQALRHLGAVVEAQPNRAGRFRGRVYLGELCLQSGDAKLARQMLSLLEEEAGTIKLEDWEPELCARLWAGLYKAIDTERKAAGSDAPKDDSKKMEDLFARICRVDANQAVELRST